MTTAHTHDSHACDECHGSGYDRFDHACVYCEGTGQLATVAHTTQIIGIDNPMIL